VSEFRALGHALVDLMATHLEQAQRCVTPVMPALTPAQACAQFPSSFPASAATDERAHLLRLVAQVLEGTTALHSPRFIGHQVATPIPEAALIDMCSSLLNNGMAIFEMGKAGTAMERAVLQHVALRMGFPSTSSGVLTSGGSLGNLTALLAARQARAGFDVWHGGMKHGPALAVLVAETAHYSVARAARIAGFGNDGCIPVEVDEHLRMKPAALERALAAARTRKRTVVAVVASAGSTAAGAIDPLNDIADVCEAQQVWLHVDGAHGGALVFSDAHKSKLRGIERADSVVLDFHKMMLMPALSTAVLFRDAKTGAAAFAQQAGYLFDDDRSDDAWSDIGKRTVECTKRTMSWPVYAMLQTKGTAHFAHHIDACVSKTRAFAEMIAAEPRLELLTMPDINITCFRVRGMSAGATAALRKAIIDEGTFYIVQVHLGRELWLRTTLLHPDTSIDDLRALLARVLASLTPDTPRTGTADDPHR
jgi:L-2,4-diaminobutyrate decarboxylase